MNWFFLCELPKPQPIPWWTMTDWLKQTERNVVHHICYKIDLKSLSLYLGKQRFIPSQFTCYFLWCFQKYVQSNLIWKATNATNSKGNCVCFFFIKRKQFVIANSFLSFEMQRFVWVELENSHLSELQQHSGILLGSRGLEASLSLA